MRQHNVWAIVLAGGEGTRVRGFLKQLCGGDGLKQFSPIIGRRSMLQHTLDRIQRLVPPERTLIVVGAHQSAEAARQLSHWPPENIIYQPANRDTAPGILLPFAYITHRDPSATVIVSPSDHFVRDEDRFIHASHANQQVDVAEDGFGAVRAKCIGLLKGEFRLAKIALLFRRLRRRGADAIVIDAGDRAAEF